MSTLSDNEILGSSSDSSVVKTEVEYVESNSSNETISDGFARVFSAYKRQSAGVIKEYKNKQEYRSRSERRKIKAETARKRNAKKMHRTGRNNGQKFV